MGCGEMEVCRKHSMNCDLENRYFIGLITGQKDVERDERPRGFVDENNRDFPQDSRKE